MDKITQLTKTIFNNAAFLKNGNPFTVTISKRFRPQPLKRFYAKVEVNQSGDEYEILLDKRKLKTPSKNIVLVKDRGLAYAICTEWSSQKDTIALHYMHLTALVNTVIDNPHKKTKYDLVNELCENISTDTLLFRSSTEHPKLETQQKLKWDPIVKWFEEKFELDPMNVQTDSLIFPEIAQDTRTKIQNHLLSFNLEAVQGLLYASGAIRSLILTLAAVHDKISIEDATTLSRLEADFQTEHWGKVEWAHEIEIQDSLSRFSAGILFFKAHTPMDTI